MAMQILVNVEPEERWELRIANAKGENIKDATLCGRTMQTMKVAKYNSKTQES